MQQHLRDYIFAVVQHFPNVYAWDVVNEVASDTPNAANPYRTDSPWYIAYSVGGLDGSDYVRDAFTVRQPGAHVDRQDQRQHEAHVERLQHRAAGKRANVIQIVQRPHQRRHAPSTASATSSTCSSTPTSTQVTAALAAVEGVSSTLVNHVTELDVSIYADPGSCYSRSAPFRPAMADYGASPPQTVLSQQALLYRALFNAFNRPSVTSVTTWGIADNHTWLNSFPVTRTNRPLLFDTAGNPKWAFWAVVDPSIQFRDSIDRREIRDNRSRTIDPAAAGGGT